MLYDNQGLLEGSEHITAQPSAMAQSMLLYAESCGVFNVSNLYSVNRLYFGNYLLIAVKEGRIFCSSGSNTAYAGPGDVILIDCHTPHTYYAVKPSVFAFLHFAGSGADRLYEAIYGGDRVMIAGGQGIFDSVKQIAEQCREASHNEFLVSAEIYRILMLLCAAAAKQGAEGYDSRTVEDIKSYIIEHLAETLTVDGLAARAGYSAAYFSRIFRRATGYTPYAFILLARLELSQRLLLTTDLSIQQVAERSGFPSQANFAFMFRREFGCTPGSYRKTMGG